MQCLTCFDLAGRRWWYHAMVVCDGTANKVRIRLIFVRIQTFVETCHSVVLCSTCHCARQTGCTHFTFHFTREQLLAAVNGHANWVWQTTDLCDTQSFLFRHGQILGIPYFFIVSVTLPVSFSSLLSDVLYIHVV